MRRLPAAHVPIAMIRAAIEHAVLRVRLLAALETEPLDELIPRLIVERVDPVLGLESLERGLDCVDMLLSRAPGLPQTCLYRALARFAVLRRRGFDVGFALGVAPPSSQELAGHAWIELGGAPRRDRLARDLVVTYRYPQRTTLECPQWTPAS